MTAQSAHIIEVLDFQIASMQRELEVLAAARDNIASLNGHVEAEDEAATTPKRARQAKSSRTSKREVAANDEHEHRTGTIAEKVRKALAKSPDAKGADIAKRLGVRPAYVNHIRRQMKAEDES